MTLHLVGYVQGRLPGIESEAAIASDSRVTGERGHGHDYAGIAGFRDW